jgi:hypothetical protein
MYGRICASFFVLFPPLDFSARGLKNAIHTFLGGNHVENLLQKNKGKQIGVFEFQRVPEALRGPVRQSGAHEAPLLVLRFAELTRFAFYVK